MRHDFQRLTHVINPVEAPAQTLGATPPGDGGATAGAQFSLMAASFKNAGGNYNHHHDAMKPVITNIRASAEAGDPSPQPSIADAFVFRPGLASHDLDDDWCGTGPSVPWEPPLPPDWDAMAGALDTGACADMDTPDLLLLDVMPL